MARKTTAVKIAELEAKIEALQAKSDEHESYRALSAQGEAGSSSEFSNIQTIYTRLDKLENRLQTLYRQSESED